MEARLLFHKGKGRMRMFNEKSFSCRTLQTLALRSPGGFTEGDAMATAMLEFGASRKAAYRMMRTLVRRSLVFRSHEDIVALYRISARGKNWLERRRNSGAAIAESSKQAVRQYASGSDIFPAAGTDREAGRFHRKVVEEIFSSNDNRRVLRIEFLRWIRLFSSAPYRTLHGVFQEMISSGILHVESKEVFLTDAGRNLLEEIRSAKLPDKEGAVSRKSENFRKLSERAREEGLHIPAGMGVRALKDLITAASQQSLAV